jgi:hypothetical protein
MSGTGCTDPRWLSLLAHTDADGGGASHSADPCAESGVGRGPFLDRHQFFIPNPKGNALLLRARHKPFLYPILALCVLLPLSGVINGIGIDGIRSVNVVAIFASGMAMGVLITLLLGGSREPPREPGRRSPGPPR